MQERVIHPEAPLVIHEQAAESAQPGDRPFDLQTTFITAESVATAEIANPRHSVKENGCQSHSWAVRIMCGTLLCVAGLGGWLIHDGLRGTHPASAGHTASPVIASSLALPASNGLYRAAYENIEDIQVGMRVLTPETEPGSQAPTTVDPATWKKISLHLEDKWPDGTLDVMTVETLQPIWWLHINQAAVGRRVLIPMDLEEMGVPPSLGEITAIEPCPVIQEGPGQVVLTTVNHLNNFLYRLTLRDLTDHDNVLGVTGWHKFDTVDRGWVSASELTLGEEVRSAYGHVIVKSRTRMPGAFRVYNMTVEAEHSYFVGQVAALVHNVDCVPNPMHLPEYQEYADQWKEWATQAENVRSGQNAEDVEKLLQETKYMIETGQLPTSAQWSGPADYAIEQNLARLKELLE